MKQQSNKNLSTLHLAKNSQAEDGFSSEEIEQQQIVYTIPEHAEDFIPAIEENKNGHQKQQTRQVVSKRYSLEPDMLNGWAPKISLSKPIPLIFCNAELDQMIQYLLANNKRGGGYEDKEQQAFNIQLCYLGARYETTYYAWYDKQFQFPYKHLSAPKNICFTDRTFVGQHWEAEKTNILRFDSLFQSGNLDCAIKVAQNQYDLFMRVDSNTKGHLQWFNFRVSNMETGRAYKLNICNFQKGKNLYIRGMRPYCYSRGKYENQKVGWHQIMCEVKYRKKLSKSQKCLDYEMSERYYQLSFEITTKYQNDELQLAYCVPYTYSRLKQYLLQLKQQTNLKNICAIKKLCISLGGHEIDQLTITQNCSEQELSFKNKTKLQKKIVFVTGRCHPGQSNGSWMVEGLIDFLCGATDTADFLRKNVIFKIIPMLNPDGVILGNYRTGLFGKDFNRQFNNPDKDIFPEVYYLKQMFWNYKKIYSENAFIYLDFHGHSTKKNVFAYGPQYPITHKNYYEARMVTKFIALKSRMFRYHSCIFKISESKQSTGRAIFLKSHKIPFTFTIEASNGSYFDQDHIQNRDFDEHAWKEVGQKVIEGVSEYLKLVTELQRIRDEKLKERKEIIMKNRERVKTKKTKNSAQLGYLTSMGFRKCKTLNNQEGPVPNSFSFQESHFLEDMTNQIKQLESSQRLRQIFQEIKKQRGQQNQNGAQKQTQSQQLSDDEISEGNSDSESSKDDLDESQQKELLLAIKQRKKKKISKKTLTEANKFDRAQLKGQQANQCQDQEGQCKASRLNQKAGTKEVMMRKYMWKKKNSVYSSLSPKKQDQMTSMAAKIVNFSFSLNPVECPNYQAASANSNFHSTSFTSKSSSNCLNLKTDDKGLKFGFQQKNNPHRTAQYSQTFKKTFISVQKQILRRDSHKRYLVSLNNQSQGKQKNNWLIENIRGKKIGQINDSSSKYQEQRNFSQQKNSQFRSPIKSSTKLIKNLRGPKQPQSQMIIFQIQEIGDLSEPSLSSKQLKIKVNPHFEDDERTPLS